MDIDLDFSNFPSHRGYVRDKIGTLVRTICDPRESPIIEYERIEFELPPPEYARQVQELLSCLSGPEGEHCRRWRSLSWEFPVSQIIASLLYSGFQGVTPHLKTLKICDAPPNFYSDDVPPQHKFDAPNLECLQLDLAISLSQFVGFAGSLRELDMIVVRDIINMPSISFFPLLQVLKIRSFHCHSTTIQPFIITLPHLITFTVTGNMEIFRPLQLDFPVLQSLNLINGRNFNGFPQLSPLHIYWEDHMRGDSKERTETILRMSSKLLTLTVPAAQAQSTWKIVKQYQSEGNIPVFTYLRVKVGEEVVNIEDWDALGIVD
jgi:hypothetical protein